MAGSTPRPPSWVMDTEREAIRLAGRAHTVGHYQEAIMTVGELAHAERPGRAARSSGRRRAAGIYGTIITAAVIAAIGVRLTTLALVVSVLVTLLVYWVAEEYAELLGEQLEAGRLPTWLEVRTALAATWPMVSASYHVSGRRSRIDDDRPQGRRAHSFALRKAHVNWRRRG